MNNSSEVIPGSIHFHVKPILNIAYSFLNPLSANPEKWSNTLKQFAGNLPTNCLSVFDHFMNLALKGLIFMALSQVFNDILQLSVTFCNSTELAPRQRTVST